LELLSTVGDISVSLDIDIQTNSRSWTVTFNPHEGKSPDSLTNFGNLPPLEITVVDGSLSARVETVQDGESPYRMNVVPSAVSAENVVAYDNPSVPHFEGLSTGIYKSKTHFFIQARDAHSNDIIDGPVGEVQIIESFAASQINGFFEVTFFGSTVRFDASAFTAEVEKGLQSIPGVGAVKVSSNSAKDLVIGTTVAVTKGLDTITPNKELTDFIIGDWIRIGDQDDGQLFSIIDISTVSPFTVTLSSSYMGKSQSSANIYQHGTKFNRLGYQYVVTFDPTLGDLPKLHADGTLLEGDKASVKVISCDANVHQVLRFSPLSSSSVEGQFYLTYKNERTRFISVDGSVDDFEDAILSDISSIHSISIAEVEDDSGAKTLHFRLDSFEDAADLFFAENYMMISGRVGVTATCPVASPQSPTLSTRSVAGRRGPDFVATLSNTPSSTVYGYGDVTLVSDGLYAASYTSPRVGQYSLEVQVAEWGGLTGEYFDNNELVGPPRFVQIDNVIDFSWANDGSEEYFSSVRWTGYIKPSFDETYTFKADVNGDLKLWIENELIIDHQHDKDSEYIKVSNTTSDVLKANQLIRIKIEHRKNTDSQTFRLLWQSTTQPLSVIDQYRLYSKATRIDGSPYAISPRAVEPSHPTNVSLAIADWDSLHVHWSSPSDDGGSKVTKYLLEYWDATMYGETEKQQLHIKQTVADGTFTITMSSQSVEIPIHSSALELEERLESLRNIGDVTIYKTMEANVAVYDIEFLTNVSPVPIMNVNIPSETLDNVEYCVCAKGNTVCDSGSLPITCKIDATREGTISTQSVEVIVDSKANSTDFSHTLQGLDQPSDILDGFGVRITAANVNGYGIPSPAVTLKPIGPPLPPIVVELKRVSTSSSNLVLHFTSVPSPDDRSSTVTSYYVEWSTSEDFAGSTVFNSTLNLDSIQSERLPSFGNVNRDFYKFLLQGLTPGLEYFVRIAAVNEAGIGPSCRSFPSALAPGSKPSDLEDQHGVSLTTLQAGVDVSVLESSSSLQLSWRAPVSSNGFAISSYLVEYWLASGSLEIQEIVLHTSNGSEVRGTFALTYGSDTTDSLSINASSEDVMHALESLSTIRSVKVWRSGENPNYKWTVTFLSEYPTVSGVMLIVDGTTKLEDALGGSPTLQVNLLTAGEYPLGYNSAFVAVNDEFETHYHHVLTDLTAGQSYHVQVSAANELGFGRPQASTPRALAPPIQKPSKPRNVILRVASSQSLEVIFSKPESDGGDDVTLYRIEWDITSNFSSNNNSPIGSYSFIPPKNGVGCDPCMYQVAGLTKGQDYFVRVYAYNSRGYSIDPGLPTPLSLVPKTAPDPPSYVNISPKSDTSIQITFPPVADDGGAQVTMYKIEWNAMGYSTGMQSMNHKTDALLYSRNNVQSITLTGEGDDIEGTFRIAFGGHCTKEISVKSTAHDMKVALESLPTVGSTVVSQRTMSNGSIWAITFLTNLGNNDKFGPVDLLTVSTNPDDSPQMFVTDTMGSLGSSLRGTGARLFVKEEISAFKGFEQQMVTTQCTTSSGIMDGYFAISVDGVRTRDIKHDASALDMKLELENISYIGEVEVTRSKLPGSNNSFQWTIIFTEKLGNVPLLSVHDYLKCSDGSATPLIYITETVQGVLPKMDGPFEGEIELNASEYAGDIVYIADGLVRGMAYTVRVSAWNGAGDSYGRAQYSKPAILTPMDKPDPPSFVEMSSIDNSTIQINWNAALNKGGSHKITKYKAEVAEVVPGMEVQFNDDDSNLFYESFDVNYTLEVQAIILESSADDMGGFFVVNFMGESTPSIYTDAEADDIKEALEGISTIDSVDVSIYPHTQDFITTYGQRWIITFTSQQGNLPSILIDSGSGQPSTIATGGTILGSSSIIRVETISNGGLPSIFITPPILDEGKLYTSRISSFNGNSWSDSTISHNSISPSKCAPSPPRDVLVNVLSDTELGVSWKASLFDGGSSIAGYKIVWGDNDDMIPASQLFFLLNNLDPEESFLVSVTAFNSRGFSDPTLAKPLLCPMELIESMGMG
jgi:copper chaperone CopZ